MGFICDIKIMGVESRMKNIIKTKKALHLTDRDIVIDKKMRMSPFLSSLDVLGLPEDINVTHRLILQDDILLATNFIEFINMLVNIAPDAIFSLYSFTGYKPYRKEAKILRTGGKIWGPATIIPIKYRDTLFSLAEAVRSDYIHDDGFYSYYAKKNGIEVLTTCPNVVQLENNGSFFNHRFTKTRTFVEDPLALNWILDKEDSLCCPCSIKDNDILKMIDYGKVAKRIKV